MVIHTAVIGRGQTLASTISSPPRTLLEALVRQRHWSHAEFCRAYARIATDELRTVQTVTTQTAGRWQLKGLPYPAQQRVLRAMFGYEAAVLLGPPEAIPATAVERTDGPDDQVQQAATESAQFLMRAERTNVGPHTLDQFAAELRRIVTVYPNRPVYPLFVQLRELRDRA